VLKKLAELLSRAVRPWELLSFQAFVSIGSVLWCRFSVQRWSTLQIRKGDPCGQLVLQALVQGISRRSSRKTRVSSRLGKDPSDFDLNRVDDLESVLSNPRIITEQIVLKTCTLVIDYNHLQWYCHRLGL
jgi:hypothetical protein